MASCFQKEEWIAHTCDVVSSKISPQKKSVLFGYYNYEKKRNEGSKDHGNLESLSRTSTLSVCDLIFTDQVANRKGLPLNTKELILQFF